jgi:hypothetical protein
MPTDTLQFYYDPYYRPNRRLPKYPVLQALLRLILWIVALMVIIGVLMKLGIIQEPGTGDSGSWRTASLVCDRNAECLKARSSLCEAQPRRGEAVWIRRGNSPLQLRLPA